VLFRYDSDLEYTDFPEYPEEYCLSGLPSAVEILKTASSLQHLTIDISIDDDIVWDKIDFSPLTVLAESFASFRHIDLYNVQIVSRLSRYQGLKKLIEQGVLVIHAEETAPGILDL
jgi:hypothetical protein